MKRTLLASFLLLLSTAVWSQAQPPAPAPGHPAPRSTRTTAVTLRFRDPGAHEVMLALEGAKPAPMQKDDQDVWSLTTGPLDPDFYGYSFVADGVGLIDPSNPLMKPNLLHTRARCTCRGRLRCPGKSAMALTAWSITISISLEWWAISGTFTFTRRRATIRGQRGLIRCSICCTGSAMTPSGWTAVGRANVILDNLIAQGKAKADDHRDAAGLWRAGDRSAGAASVRSRTAQAEL